MKLLVTGAAGFVGSNLISSLLESGNEVVGIDNFSYGYLRNIEHFLNNSKFKFIKADLRNKNVFEDIKCEAIIHLASQKIPRYSNALRTIEDNSQMTSNVIEKCKKDKIKLVFASTSDVYGKNPKLPYTEESDLLLGPTTVKRWSYAISKIYAEQQIIAYKEEYGIEFTIMRFFGSYGPNQNTTWWGGPQSVFIQNILENKPIEIHGDGKQTRVFTFIEDTVQGIIKCIFEQKAKNEIFNISAEGDEEISINDLAKKISIMMKDKGEAEINFIPYERFGKYEDVQRRVGSIDKIKNLLNFSPLYSLEEGLKKTIEWQSNLKQQS